MRTIILLAMIVVSAHARAQPVAGAVDVLTGTATMAIGTTPPTPLQAGAAIPEGAELHTGANARLRLKLSDGTSFSLGAESAVRFEHLSPVGDPAPTVLRHLLGYLRAVVAPQRGHALEINTDSETAAVRGTDWIERTEPGTTEVFVASGHVYLRGRGGAVVLGSGQGVTFHAARPHTPVIRWAPAKVAAFRAATSVP